MRAAASYWTTLVQGLIDGFPNITEHDVILTAQPFHYIDPQWNVALGLASGCRLVVLDRFHPSSFWSKIIEYGVTWFYCLGMMPKLLLNAPAPASPTRCGRSARRPSRPSCTATSRPAGVCRGSKRSG